MKNARFLVLFFTAWLVTLLSACGAGSVKDPLLPKRVVVFGDNLSVQTGGARYTVNGSGGVDNWANQIASLYNISSFSSNAVANALVSDVAAQVNTFGSAYQESDLVVMSAGFRDLIDLAQSSPMPSTDTAKAQGHAYGNVVRAAIAKGAKHVVVTNVYDFSTSYGAQAGVISTAATMKTLIRAFNDALKVNLGNPALAYIGDNVRLIDSEYYMNLVIGSPVSYGFTGAVTAVCTVTSTGIGIGTKADSSLCTTTNVGAAYTATYNNYVYADAVYLTPAAHRSLGAYAYNAAKARW